MTISINEQTRVGRAIIFSLADIIHSLSLPDLGVYLLINNAVVPRSQCGNKPSSMKAILSLFSAIAGG
ncbi:thiamine biosynthesis protein ThiS [Vibrio chagasii]|nr:thiamine biosynthesis protein ThiS [Vibrio chagasii]